MPKRTKPLAPTWAAWGERVRAARLDVGLTQIELADRVGISQYTVSRIENGTYGTTDETKLAVAGALSTTVEALFPYPEAVPA